MNEFNLHQGDCLDILKTLPDNSVDSIVTDPPYGLSFMGKKWDYDVPTQAVWEECLRVLKPGGHLLAFAGTRTQHRMAVRIEDAGFEIRDMIAWLYGSGFPKSMDVSKAIDKAAGAEREVVGENEFAARRVENKSRPNTSNVGGYANAASSAQITAPATDAARQWSGWGTALKPALEPITVARKPLIGTVAANVLQHGTGALNIDGCRIEGAKSSGSGQQMFSAGGVRKDNGRSANGQRHGDFDTSQGRFPANVIHDGSDEVIAVFPNSAGAGGSVPNVKITGYGDGIGTGKSDYLGGERTKVDSGSGTAARFFYCAKASRKDRNEGLASSDTPLVENGATMREQEDADGSQRNGNHHPTVKPTDLMAYLVRLVTPLGGVVLDPFMGSGSTGKACMREGFRFIGCELSDEYLSISRSRIEHELAKRAPVPLPVPVQTDLFV